jgi:AraC-like DNA-binding protein
VIRSLVSDIETALLLVIPKQSAPLQLLANYIAAVHKDIAVTPEVRRLVAGHAHDLVALAIGMARDAAYGATRVDRSMRLRAVKASIVDKLDRRDLAVNLIAEHHRLSPRYLQRLFKDDGTTFSEFVLDRRLDRAYHMLSDPDMAGRTISAVAFACGFGDLSYFNRRFRSRYGMPPSEARVALRRE